MLELQIRQGLSPDEIADALGVTRNNVNQIASRMRTNLERSLTAVMVLRDGPGVCTDLDAIAGRDTPLTPLVRKRVARHIDQCAICDDDRARRAIATFGESPASAAPISARSDVLASIDAGVGTGARLRLDARGFPTTSHRVARTGVLVAVAAVVLVVLLVASVGILGDGTGGSTATRRSETRASNEIVPGSDTDDGTAADGDAGSAASGSSGSRSSTTRAGGPSTSTRSSTTVVTATTVAAPPTITAVDLSSPYVYAKISSTIRACGVKPTTAIVYVSVTTPDAVRSVDGDVIDPSGRSTALTFTRSGSTWSASFGSFTSIGTATIERLRVTSTSGAVGPTWGSTPKILVDC